MKQKVFEKTEEFDIKNGIKISSLIDKFKNENLDNLTVYIRTERDYDDGIDYYLCISKVRNETDEEYALRLAAEKKIADKLAAQEKKRKEKAAEKAKKLKEGKIEQVRKEAIKLGLIKA